MKNETKEFIVKNYDKGIDELSIEEYANFVEWFETLPLHDKKVIVSWFVYNPPSSYRHMYLAERAEVCPNTNAFLKLPQTRELCLKIWNDIDSHNDDEKAVLKDLKTLQEAGCP